MLFVKYVYRPLRVVGLCLGKIGHALCEILLWTASCPRAVAGER